MNHRRIAVSTNDYKNLSMDTFGQSHYFEVYDLEKDVVKKVNTRENVLFRQACSLQGRIEHLHGLLGDVRYLVGTGFRHEVRQALERWGHQIIQVPGEKISTTLNQLRTIHIPSHPEG